MAGGVQTCQLTQMPLCNTSIMAIMVRQSVYYIDDWMPMTIPSFGRGNDDFMALDPLVPSVVQDEFAHLHNLDGMEELLSEGFTGGNYLPRNMKEERLRGIPVGLVYVDVEMWEELRKKVIKNLHPSMDWIHPKNAATDWAASFMMAVERHAESEARDIRLDFTPRSIVDEGWNFFNDWGKISKYSSVSQWLSSWSEHQTLFSLESYLPLAVKYAKAAIAAPESGPDLANLIEFFEGVETLMLLSKAIYALRQDWKPKSTMQEYDISPVQDEVARLIRKKYRTDKKKD